MSVVPRKLKHQTVFWVVNLWQGAQAWERVGPNRRAAELRDATMRREIAAGAYVPRKTGAATVGGFAMSWFAKRKIRSLDYEVSLFEDHIVKRARWYSRLKVEDVRSRHTMQLVEELRKPYDGRYGDGSVLSEKTIANLVGMLSTMFKHARIHELTLANPCELPFGTVKRGTSEPREPYEAADVVMLTTDPRIDWDVRVWNAIAFYTGMREGEVCGRRWRNLDRASLPLQCLTIDTQYDDKPLKTERPRKAPIHPALEAIIDEWYRKGWELFYMRKPKPGDFIIPRRDIDGAASVLTRSMAYKRFHAACATLEIAPHTLHATRNTFISMARRGGARKDVVEKITHNAKGEMIDQYTKWDWEPLCEAVMSLQVVTSKARVARRDRVST